MQKTQMQLSQKQKLCLNFFLHFPNLNQILNIFKKKMTLITDVFPKLPTPKNAVRYMSEKSPFRGPFEVQHGKREQILLKPGRQHCYHIDRSF